MASTLGTLLRRTLWGRDRGRMRATWRILLGFGVILGVLLGGSRVLRGVPFPDVLVNGPTALLVCVAVGAYALVASLVPGERPLREYGFAFDRQWALDSLAGVLAGCAFQALVTGMLFATGSARVVETFSAGVAAGGGPTAVAVAVAATAVAFAAVALWEELLFRGVFVLNASEGLAARGLEPRRAVWAAVGVGVLVFGPGHALVAAGGVSPVFAAAQASVAAVYFGAAYVLTGSLAFPIGIHSATNLWVVSVFGQAGSGFPALVRLERSIGAGPVDLLLLAIPSLLLLGLIVAWVRATRGRVSADESLRDAAERRRGPAAAE